VSKGKNLIKTKPVTVAVNTRVYEVLEDLTRNGFWGKNVAETAEELIRRGITTLEGGNSLIASSLKQSAKRKNR